MSSPEFTFSKSHARAAVEFFPRFLRLTTAEWAGRPFDLPPWLAHHTAQIFGWRRRDGTRRYRKVRGWLPKKNGKTEWAAGVAHILTIGDNEPTAEVFSYARDKNQSRIVWDRAKKMIELDVVQRGNLFVPGPLADVYEKSSTSLFCPNLMSAFKYLSGDPAGKHGPSVHGALGDEAHEWEDGDLHQYLVDGMAGRRQPLDLIISNAGEFKTYAHELYAESMAVLADPSLDPEMYVFSYQADKDDDWTDPAIWAKANPNIGVSPKLSFLESQCRNALRTPRLQNDFLRFHLGIWTEQATRWFPMHRWRDNTSTPDDAERWRKLEKELIGRPCWGGLDLASSYDINALVWVFPPDKPGGRYAFLPRFWCPETKIAERDKPQHPYKRWKESGALLTTPGNVTDYGAIVAKVLEDCEKFRVKKADPNDPTQFDLALDRYDATQTLVNLSNESIKVCRFGQGFASMNAPAKHLERLFCAEQAQLEHGNQPVLKWMFGNAAYAKESGERPTQDDGTDESGARIKPSKEHASEKIDGVVAAVMGLALADAAKPDQKIDLDAWLANPISVSVGGR